MAVDAFILAQNVVMSIVIGALKPETSGSMLLFIWISYIIGSILKVVFYFGFHPWAGLMRNDLKNILNPDEQPTWNICEVNGLFNCLACKCCCTCCHTRNESNQDPVLAEIGQAGAERIPLKSCSQGADNEHTV